MRIVVFFDLPVETSKERADYRAFRKFLIKSGYVMMQESVYSKIVLNNTACDAAISNLRKHKINKGLVQILTVTERQFERMEFLIGEADGTFETSDKRLIIV